MNYQSVTHVLVSDNTSSPTHGWLSSAGKNDKDEILYDGSLCPEDEQVKNKKHETYVF